MSTALTTSERERFDDLPFVHELYLYIYDAPVVFEATISSANDAETHVAIATDTITSGSFSDIKVGMTLELEDDDGNFRGRQRVRGTDDPNILTGRAPRSNFDGGLNPGEATVVKVYDEYRVWAKIPYIDEAGNQLRDQQTYPGADEAQPPLANNAFPAALLLSEDGGSQVAEFDASLSRGIRDGSPPLSYSWDFVDGTITSGTSTDIDPTVEFPVGDRYVSLTVTDSNGVSETTRILVCVIQRSDLIPARITRRSQGINRNDFAIESPADLLSTSIRDGAPLLVADNDSIGDFSSRFYGWLGEVSSRYPDPINGIGYVSITCEDVGTRLRKLVSFPQVVKVAEDATGSWQFLPNVDIRVLIHHMWRWYSSALEVATLDIGSVLYSLPRLQVTGNTLFEQFDRLAQAIGHRVSIDVTGAIRIIPDPVVQPTAEQKTEFDLPLERDVTVRTTLTQDDYANPQFTYTHVPRISWARAKAVVAATTADGLRVVSSIAPSKTPGQGTTESSETEQLVSNAVGQDELNVRTGNRYASRQDNPFGQLQIELAKSRGIFDPALMQVFKIQLPDTLKNRHNISDDDLWLLNNIDETFEPADGIKLATATFERITVGRPAETVAQIPPPDGIDPVDETALDSVIEGAIVDVFDDNPAVNLNGLSANLVAILSDGSIAVTSNADDAGGAVTWTVNDHSGTIGSTVYAWALKAGATAVTGWVTTSTGLFLVENAQGGSPTFTDLTPSGLTGTKGIDADYVFAPGEILTVTSSGDGDRAVHVSFDAGATWERRPAGYANRNADVLAISPGRYGLCVGGQNNGDFRAGIISSGDFWDAGSRPVFPINGYNVDPAVALGGIDAPQYFFYGTNDGSGVRRYNVDTDTDTPLNAPAAPYAALGSAPARFTISVNPNNTNDVAFAQSNGGGCYVTHSALLSAPTWIKVGDTSNVRRCALVNGGQGLYMFGANGRIKYTGETYAPNEAADLQGDLSTSAQIVGIAGY
jgi:hypothetical protein